MATRLTKADTTQSKSPERRLLAPTPTHARRLRIASFPGPAHQNPYIRLFYNALRDDVECGDAPQVLSREWIAQYGDQYDALHLHWPEYSWQKYKPRYIRCLDHIGVRGATRMGKQLYRIHSVAGTREFQKAIAEAKAKGLRIVWTYHNTEPHNHFRRSDDLGLQSLAYECDLVIAHDERAINRFKELYPDSGTPVLMAHGNYEGAFPNPATRERTYETYGLNPNLPLFVAIGAIRPYKGFDIVTRAAPLLEGRAQILVAGADRTKRFVSDYQGTPNLRLIGEAVSDQTFADLLHAADGAMLPYSHVTGSGALLAALTLHTGVLVSDLPYFQDLLQLEPLAGTVLDDRSPQSLVKAIDEFLQPGAKPRGEAAAALSARFKWENVIGGVREVLRSWRAEIGQHA